MQIAHGTPFGRDDDRGSGQSDLKLDLPIFTYRTA
jgi:hypothetical protein